MSSVVEFDLKKIKNNINKLKQLTNNINFLFPVKCCYNPTVLEIINDSGMGFDVSNMNEFKIIEKYLTNQFVSANGPISHELCDCKYKNFHLIVNNIDDFDDNNGIRINFNSNDKFEYSRFGLDYKLLDENIRKKIKYIHFHNSDHKNAEKCENIYEEIKCILKYFPNLQIINIGGHLEDISFDEGIEYLNEVRKIIPENIAVYAELGDFLFKDVGTLYTEVVGVRNDDKFQVVTLNISKMANQRWTYPEYIEDTSDNELIRTIFGGNTCCETDVYLETMAKPLKIGDKVVFRNISPYSYQWNISFNGIEKTEYRFK